VSTDPDRGANQRPRPHPRRRRRSEPCRRPRRHPRPGSGLPDTGYAERRVPALAVALTGARAVVRVLTRTSVAGSPPATGGCVVAANHLSLLDPLLLGTAVDAAGRVPRFLAARGLWSVPGLGYALRACEQIPVRRDGGRAVEAVDLAVAAAAAGRCVVVYPEGRITRDPAGWPVRARTGAVRIAAAAGVPLVPTACWGTNLVLPLGVRLPRPVPRRTCSMVFGEPVDVPELLGRRADSSGSPTPTPTAAITLTPEQARAATEALSDRVDALLAVLRGQPRPGPRLDVRRPGHAPR